MSTLKLLLVIISVYVLGVPSYSQEESDSLSTTIDEECVSDSSDSFDFDFNWERDGFALKGSPTISLSYGQSQIKHKDFSSNITKPNLLELKLGYTSIYPYKYSEVQV